MKQSNRSTAAKNQVPVKVNPGVYDIAYGNVRQVKAVNAPKTNDIAKNVLNAIALSPIAFDDKGNEITPFGHNMNSAAGAIDTVIIKTLGQCSIDQIMTGIFSIPSWRNKAKSVYPNSHKLAGQVKGTACAVGKVRAHIREYMTQNSHIHFMARMSRAGVKAENKQAVCSYLNMVAETLLGHLKAYKGKNI